MDNKMIPYQQYRLLYEKLKTENKNIFNNFNPDHIISIFDGDKNARKYQYVPENVKNIWNSLYEQFGVDGFDRFQKSTMLLLIENFEARASSNTYTPDILERFSISFARIAHSVADPASGRYEAIDDLLLKDLGLCRQVLFPAGARVIDPDSGFSRTLVYRDGLIKGYEFLLMLLRHGGHAPYYQWHTHLSELEEFNAEGWTKFCLRVADMLQVNPHVKGVFGSSWIYDPALAEISPNLAYHNEEPLRNGAYLFLLGDDPDGGALAKSATRRRLYEEGKYMPKSYALIWPRQPIINWSRRFKAADTTHSSNV